MNIKTSLLLCTVAYLFSSCETDICNQTVEYTKATGIYLDIEELRSTPLNAPIRDIKNAGKIYVAEDFTLIGEEGEGIHVIDTKDATNPQTINFINIPMNHEFIVHGNSLFAESHYDMLQIDLSDLTNVRLENRASDYLTSVLTNDEGHRLIGFETEKVTEKLPCDTDIKANIVNYIDWKNQLIPPSTVPSSFAGNSAGATATLNKSALSNNYLYCVTDEDLHVFQATSDLTKVNTLEQFSSGMETILIREKEAFFGKMDGMTIADLSDPVQPRAIKEYRHERTCDPVLPHNDVAYVTLRAEDCGGSVNLLDVIDLTSNSTQLSALERIEMDSPFGMAIINETLFVGEGTNGLKTFDIRNERTPILTNWFQDVEAYDVMLHPNGQMLLVTGSDGLNTYSLDQTQSLTFLSNVAY